MPTPPPNGPSEEPSVRAAAALPEGVEDLIAEVEALRAVLHDGAGRAGRLALALKQQRRQAKALKSALSSLRGLPGW